MTSPVTSFSSLIGWEILSQLYLITPPLSLILVIFPLRSQVYSLLTLVGLLPIVVFSLDIRVVVVLAAVPSWYSYSFFIIWFPLLSLLVVKLNSLAMPSYLMLWSTLVCPKRFHQSCCPSQLFAIGCLLLFYFHFLLYYSLG